MKALLLKDWYLLKQYCRMFLLLELIFVGVSCAAPENTFYLIYPIILASIIAATLYSYDDKEGWLTFAATLPQPRALLVTAKYLVAFLLSTSVALLLLAVHGLRLVLLGQPDLAAEFGLLLVALLPMAGAGLLVPAVILPPMFKLGAEKGRLFYIAAVAIACAASIIFMNDRQILVNGHPTYLGLGIGAAGAIYLVSLVIYALSWRLSVRFHQGRELS